MSEITVILPVYNNGLYLKEAIESIISQTFKDFILLIINDASTDSSEQIILSFKDERIKYVRNETNLGLIGTLNKALSLVDTPYVARMDADDIALSERFELQLAEMKKNPHVAMVCSPVIGLTPGGKLRDHWPSDINANTWEKIRKTLPYENCISHPTIFIKTDIVKKYWYSNNQKGSEDWDLWLRLARDNQVIIKTNKELLYYRIHPESMTQLENASHSPQIKSIKVKMKFIFSSLKNFRLNLFVLVTLLSILKDYQYFLRKRFLPNYLRKLKWFFTINPFQAYKQFVSLKNAMLHHSTEYFLFFPYSHLGGAEKVHGEITKVIDSLQPFVFFTGIHNHQFRPEYFGKNAFVLHIASALYHPFWSKKCERLIVSKIISSEKPIVFGANNQFFEKLVPNLPSKVFTCDLTHDITYNKEEFFSVSYGSYIMRLDKRIFISKAAIDRTKIFYEKIFLDNHYTDRIELAYNFVNAPFKTGVTKFKQPFTIIYCGRDTHEKRTDRIFALAEACERKKIQVRFVMAGEIKMPRNFQSKNVQMMGMINDPAKLSELYDQSHFVIISSDSEGFPLSLAEGMIHGCIPLSTPVGDIPNHIKHRENGFLSGTNSDNAVNEFLAILESAAERDLTSVSEQARAYAEKKFNYQSFYKFYRNLFRLPL